MALALAAVAVGFGLAACGDDDPGPESSPAQSAPAADDAPAPGSDAPATPEDSVGFPLDRATALADADGRPWRVIERDGEKLAVTGDFVEDRLNFVVEDGLVIETKTDAELAQP